MRRYPTLPPKKTLRSALALWAVMAGAVQAEQVTVDAPNNPSFDQHMGRGGKSPSGVKGSPNALTGASGAWVDDGQGGLRGAGHRPDPLDRRHMRGAKPQTMSVSPPAPVTTDALTLANTPHRVTAPMGYSAPVSFDARSLGFVTPVRDQGSCGDCWTFAAMGAMESEMLAAGDASFILSPNHLNVRHGFAWAACAGGNNTMSMAYLSRWGDASGRASGPVWDVDDPYTNTKGTSVAGLTPRYHTQDIWVLPDKASGEASSDNLNWKYALQQVGGLAVSFYIDTSTQDNSTRKPKYWRSSTASYYYNQPNTSSPQEPAPSNHMVTLVGWDDRYAASNFATRPPGDGAYVMKNQWGSSWGQNGYFYVSYYDTSLQDAVAYLPPEPVSNYTHQFMHDPHGQTSASGYSGSKIGWGGNIFTAGAAEPSLQAVSFFTNDIDVAFEARIYTHVGSTPSAGTLQSAATVTGTLPYAGYHTIRLASPVTLAPNEKFSVVVKFVNSTSAYPVPLERSVPGFTSSVISVAGRSFISHDGRAWSDRATSGDQVNIRAMTGLSLDALPDAQQGQAYRQNLHVSDGTGPYTYAVTRGSLPAGLSLASDGTLSGTPGTSGRATFMISATDSTPVTLGGPFTGARTYTLTVQPSSATKTQSIHFSPAPRLSVGTQAEVKATATSGLPVSFSSTTPLNCPLDGSTLTGLKAGPCTVAATQDGDAIYLSAPRVTQDIPVTANAGTLTQSISFASMPPLMVGGTVTLMASASSGLSVHLDNTTPAYCTLSSNSTSGATLTGLVAGNCVLEATQGGDAFYNAAPMVTLSIPVRKAEQTVSFSSVPTNVQVGSSATLVASASSKLPVSYGTLTPSVCTVNGAQVIGVAAGSCTVSVDQVGNAYTSPAPQASASFPVTDVVLKAQQISLLVPTTVTIGSIGTVSASATSGLGVILRSDTPSTCTVTGYTLTPVAVGSCKVSATQPGDSMWKAADAVSKSLNILAAPPFKTQSISFAPAATLVRGTTLSLSAKATSGLAVRFTSSSPTLCSISGTTLTGLNLGTCQIQASQTGDATWKPAPPLSKAITIVAPALKTQSISFAPSTPNTLTRPATVNLVVTSTSGLPVRLTSTSPTICTLNGTMLTGVEAGICKVSALQAGDSVWKAADTVARTITVK
ncbi:MAG: lectin like domain-containing protein [Leptothrix ochracea]|uniref:lectin like domain-containing protein n=1 Tax=Leptothrix ochracea TaxID=735331 RepID=UPI0034E1DDEB